jgi:hypothetical protein
LALVFLNAFLNYGHGRNLLLAIIHDRDDEDEAPVKTCKKGNSKEPTTEKRPELVEHQPFHIARRDAHPFLGLRAISSQKRLRDVVAVSLGFH